MAARRVAGRLSVLFRLMTSNEVHGYLLSFTPKERRVALESWLRTATELIGEGVQHYAVRNEVDRI